MQSLSTYFMEATTLTRHPFDWVIIMGIITTLLLILAVWPLVQDLDSALFVGYVDVLSIVFVFSGFNFLFHIIISYWLQCFVSYYNTLNLELRGEETQIVLLCCKLDALFSVFERISYLCAQPCFLYHIILAIGFLSFPFSYFFCMPVYVCCVWVFGWGMGGGTAATFQLDWVRNWLAHMAISFFFYAEKCWQGSSQGGY